MNLKLVVFIIVSVLSIPAYSEIQKLDTRISKVAVTGGSDSPVNGVSCFRMQQRASNRCGNGWIAIPNNNSELLNIVLEAKYRNSNVNVVYYDEQSQLKCPSIVYTNCQLQSVIVQ